VCWAATLAATFAATLAATLAATPLGAQQAPPFLQPEVRADVLVHDVPSLELGGGLIARAGYYGRIALVAGAGGAWRDGRAAGTAHVDLVSRFLLDPFREVRWGLYGGGGATFRWSERGRAQPYLLLVGGVEGPEHGTWRPAVELGLGGGARLGIVLRRARNGAR